MEPKTRNADATIMGLNTVCQEASCPNIGECFAGGTELTAVFADTFDGYEDDANCKLRSGGSVAGVGGYVELPYPSLSLIHI